MSNIRELRITNNSNNIKKNSYGDFDEIVILVDINELEDLKKTLSSTVLPYEFVIRDPSLIKKCTAKCISGELNLSECIFTELGTLELTLRKTYYPDSLITIRANMDEFKEIETVDYSLPISRGNLILECNVSKIKSMRDKHVLSDSNSVSAHIEECLKIKYQLYSNIVTKIKHASIFRDGRIKITLENLFEHDDEYTTWFQLST